MERLLSVESRQLLLLDFAYLDDEVDQMARFSRDLGNGVMTGCTTIISRESRSRWSTTTTMP